jgi:hypothetical protein
MDLNHLYSQHQLSLIRAKATTSRLLRTRHLAAAGVAANRIRNYQLAKGAAAAAGWFRSSENLDRQADAAWGAST